MFPDRGGASWAPHSGDRRTLVDQIGFELSPHAFAEEVVLYPLRPEVGTEERLPRRRRPALTPIAPGPRVRPVAGKERYTESS
ncbi:hypothetical protein SUDANB106_00252 [Streptomyces sp. enrichment culture]|uniref:hypothetical protein n=1 Tax=Streptomyces sp. enrichment culture TaxID=1795815 RepID=UPI003F57FCAB